MGGLGGDPADVGLIAPDAISNNSFLLPLSNTSDVVDIESTSNVLIEGLWIFRVDNQSLIFPGTGWWSFPSSTILMLLWFLVVLLFVCLLLLDMHGDVVLCDIFFVIDLMEPGSGLGVSGSGSGDGGK